MENELFPRTLGGPFFLHYNLDCTGSLWYQFGSLWTTPWPDEKDLFLKFVIREIRKFPYEKLTFFLGKLYQKFFSFYTPGTHGILHTEFGLIWKNSLTRWRRPVFKFRYSRNSQTFVRKTFFPRQAIAKILFLLHSTYTWDTSYRVCFDLDNSMTWSKRPIFKNYSKLLIRKNRKLPYEILTFFLGKLKQIYFSF